MGSSCENGNCPRCLGINTFIIATSWRPIDTYSGVCLRCGFEYHNVYQRLDKTDLNLERENEKDCYDEDEKEEWDALAKEFNRKITKKEQKNMKEFDEMY